MLPGVDVPRAIICRVFERGRSGADGPSVLTFQIDLDNAMNDDFDQHVNPDWCTTRMYSSAGAGLAHQRAGQSPASLRLVDRRSCSVNTAASVGTFYPRRRPTSQRIENVRYSRVRAFKSSSQLSVKSNSVVPPPVDTCHFPPGPERMLDCAPSALEAVHEQVISHRDLKPATQQVRRTAP